MFMVDERKSLERYAPGLDAELSHRGVLSLEADDPQNLAALAKRHRLPGLLVPQQWGGRGIPAHDAIRVQRAIGARSPSLGVMMLMHNFTVSVCRSLTQLLPSLQDTLRGVATENHLVASGFAEGRSGAGILDSTVMLRRDGDGYRVSGAKKPCTMTHVMDVLTAGVSLLDANGEKRTGMAVIPRDAPGLSRNLFWKSKVLGAADSHEVVLDNVYVPSRCVMIASDDNNERRIQVAQAEAAGLCWFEIIASANYLGVASALAEQSMMNERVDVHERAALGIDLEGAMSALDGIVHWMEQDPAAIDECMLMRALNVRFSVQQAIERVALRAAELSGGMTFVSSDKVATLMAASRCLAFHPISRKAAEPMLASYMLAAGLAAAATGEQSIAA